jgi:L-ascorbate metabolism protein UlaG (beta-lactamase superfamily)
VVTVTLIGGPTALVEYAGLRWLTDPTFSPPGTYGGLTKATAPALTAAQIEPIDVVLLSHDQHADNLDPGGLEFLPRAGRVFSTHAAAERLGEIVTGLEPWEQTAVTTGDREVTITAVPALHGPPGSEPITGPVTGFVLKCDGEDTIYVSGDNASVAVVTRVAERLGPIDVAILFVGAVQIPTRFEGAYLTLSSDRAAIAATVLKARAVVPVHFEGWTHFTQGLEQIRAAFMGYGISNRLVPAEPGETVIA